MNKITSKISNFFNTQLLKLKENTKRGIDWVGVGGLASMESAALLVIFFMLFMPAIWSMTTSIVLVFGKCMFDKKRGSEKECHDFICATIGVVAGVILGMVHAATVLLL